MFHKNDDCDDAHAASGLFLLLLLFDIYHIATHPLFVLARFCLHYGTGGGTNALGFGSITETQVQQHSSRRQKVGIC